jgi:hypothetical protein
MEHNMADPTSSAAVAALGTKAGLGIIGAALLYMLMPPGRPDDQPTTRREMAREIGVRFTFAGITSAAGGDWVIDMLQQHLPSLLAAEHPTPFLMASGAVGWYIGRAVALWIYRRQDRDIAQLRDEIRDEWRRP